MSSINFTKAELAAAVVRGVRQCVVIGSRQPLREAVQSCTDQDLRVFVVEDDPESEPLAAALEKSEFDQHKASLFVWLGDAKYRTVEAAIASLAFIASLPRGSGVVLDYAVERTSIGSLTHTALDALASRMSIAGGVKYLIHPQAVAALLRGLGFQQIVDLAQEGLSGGGHLVSAVV